MSEEVEVIFPEMYADDIVAIFENTEPGIHLCLED